MRIQKRTAMPGSDYMTRYPDWRDAQNGCAPAQTDQLDPTRRFVGNGRDPAVYAQVDVLFQAYFNACLMS